jgi:hypothetical protein
MESDGKGDDALIKSGASSSQQSMMHAGPSAQNLRRRSMPQLNGKVERSHRSDQQEFYQLLTYKGDVDLEKRFTHFITSPDHTVPSTERRLTRRSERSYSYLTTDRTRRLQLKRAGRNIPDPLLKHIFPLSWEHINLSSIYTWDNEQHLPKGFRLLRLPVGLRRAA